jgi:acetyltransferase-like isoleucine patch superfamily enzyme
MPEVKAENRKIKKHLSLFLHKPFSYLFYLSDIFYDSVWLEFLGYFWYIECKLRGGKISKGHILGRPIFKFHPQCKIVIEENVTMVSNQRRCFSANIYGPCRLQTHSASSEIHISKGVGMNGVSIVSRSAKIFVGEYTMMAPNCVIMDSPFHRLLPPKKRNEYLGIDLDKDIWIGSNCWLGTGCYIFPGAKIGNNSVIGAGSIVTGEIPPNCIALGRPAKVVKFFE